VFAVRDIVVFAVVAGLLAGVAVAVLPWARTPRRSVVAGIATTVGFIAWNLTLNATHATGFNTDAPVIQLSWSDAGSGVIAFVVAAAALALTNRDEPAGRVVGAAAVAGAMAALLDIFIL